MDHKEDDEESIMSDIKDEPEEKEDEDFDQVEEIEIEDSDVDSSPSNKSPRKRKAPKNNTKGKSPAAANNNKRKRQNENKSSKKVDEEEEEPFDISDLGDYFLCTKCNSVSFSHVDHLITHFKKCTTPKPKGKGILGNSNKINIETKNMSSQTIPDVTTIGIQTKPETKTIYTQIRTKLTIEPKAQSSSSSQLNEDYSSNFDDDGPHSPMNLPENDNVSTHNNEGTRELILNVKFKDPVQEREMRGGPFFCSICKKQFKNQKAVNMHTISHREERQYMKCPIRGCEFRDKDSHRIAAHVRQEHPIGCMGQVSKRASQNVLESRYRSPRRR